MWAQCAMAHTKCTQTLEAESLYCRQATLSHEDPQYHDFEPDFDFAATAMAAFQADNELDDLEPLTYEQAMAGPNAHHWKDAMDKQISSFATMGTWKLVTIPAGPLRQMGLQNQEKGRRISALQSTVGSARIRTNTRC